MSTKLCNVIALSCNLISVILTVYSMSRFFKKGSGNMKDSGVKCLKYFTMESNVLAAITCAVMAVSNARVISGVAGAVSRGALIFKLVGTVSVTVTLLVVLFFLGPTIGYDKMFAGPNIFLHLATPLLCIISFVFFERGHISLTAALPALLPVFLYGIVYLIMVVFIGKEKGGWSDFYGFNRGGHWVRSLIAMYCANPLIVLAVVKLHNLFR